MKTQKLFVGVVPEKSLEYKPGAAFRGIFQLGLLAEIRRADTNELPGEFGGMRDLKSALREVAIDCANGLEGIGELMFCANTQPSDKSIASLGGLIHNLGKLAGEALERIESLEFEERAARKAEFDARLCEIERGAACGNFRGEA